jgi:diguanylate cyclase (GGDEF)-like protein
MKMKVLIIDDSPDAVAIAKARLAREHLDVLVADGGRAGMELARREMPDLVLLDIEMPDLTGFEVCAAMKSDPDLCMIPIIFLSGASDGRDKVKGLDLGAVDYVTKPFDAFELRARVRAALRTKHLQDLLIRYAHVDPLTELSNRRALMERLEQEWQRIQRHSGSLAFIMADVDHFKRVNDTYGHAVGDRLLVRISMAIARECRDVDLPARYGGEEFAVLTPGETAESAAALAERCRAAIEGMSIEVDGAEIQATASFGVADSHGAASPAEMVERADKHLYTAKKSGRNTVRTGAASEDGTCQTTPERSPPCPVPAKS